MEHTKRKIKIGKIKIRLLSDLCTSDGSSYNSSINTDICYDADGFPYIPGKRIKGCLRECAIELLDWNVFTTQDVERLFGNEESESGVRIGNAYLQGYDSMKAQIVQGNVLFHPQNIMSKYTYVREQTEIDYLTGMARGNGMLRSNRVVVKEQVFETEVEFAEELEEFLRKCCRVFTHLGMYRTRGYGEIKAELVVTGEKEWDVSNSQMISNLTDGNVTVYYTMTLSEPVICKSVAGDATVTMDYIEGAKILGSILGKLKQDGGDIDVLLDEEEFICSNAYIGEEGKRFTEVPACYYSIKNNTESFINELYPKEENQKENVQLNKMKHCYVWEDATGEGVFLKQKHVELETSYHHRRPEDKAIGHPIYSEDGSNFFHVEGITPGQQFCGFLQGSVKQMQAIRKYIEGTHYIGCSKNAEFGKVSIKITKVDVEEASATPIEASEIMVKLEAPTILYNDKAFYSIDVSDLRKKVEAELGIDIANIVKVDAYVNYVRLGGFQTTWKCRKPTIDAFDKGTVLHYVLKQPMQMKCETLFLGERVKEGYGETKVYVLPSGEAQKKKNRTGFLRKKEAGYNLGIYTVSGNPFAEELSKSVFEEFYKARVSEEVKAFVSENKNAFKGQWDRCTLVYAIILKLCKENGNWDDFIQMKDKTFIDNPKDFEKRNRKMISDKVLEATQKNIVQLQKDFCDEYKLQWNPEISEYYLGYLERFVYELKRTIPEGERRNGQTK